MHLDIGVKRRHCQNMYLSRMNISLSCAIFLLAYMIPRVSICCRTMLKERKNKIQAFNYCKLTIVISKQYLKIFCVTTTSETEYINLIY